MKKIVVQLLVVAAIAASLAACTAPAVEVDESPNPETAVSAPAAAGACPPELATSIEAEVAPTKVEELPGRPDSLPDGIVLPTTPSCVIDYEVSLGEARQVYYVGAGGEIWQELLDGLVDAGYPGPVSGVGSVAEGIISAQWFRAGNYDRTTDTTILNVGWVSGPDVERAPSDAAILGEPYMVVTVEECPCE